MTAEQYIPNMPTTEEPAPTLKLIPGGEELSKLQRYHDAVVTIYSSQAAGPYLEILDEGDAVVLLNQATKLYLETTADPDDKIQARDNLTVLKDRIGGNQPSSAVEEVAAQEAYSGMHKVIARKMKKNEPLATPATIFDAKLAAAQESRARFMTDDRASWRILALCNEFEPRLFEKTNIDDAFLAKKVCQACGVMETCLIAALNNDDLTRRNEVSGVRGGHTSGERTRLKRKMKARRSQTA